MKKIILFNAEDQTDLSIEAQMADPKEFQLELRNGCPDTDMGRICADADGVITIYSSVNEQALSQMKHCKVVALQSIGFNNIDLAAATRHGVAVANAPGFCAQEVAAHTVALLLACSRQVVHLANRVRNEKRWEYGGQKIKRLQGQTVGLIAFGQIPQMMVPMLKGFGLRVIAYGPRTPEDIFKRLGVERAQNVEDLLRQADYVSLHLPLNEQTADFMDTQKFGLMKKSAYFVNTARGGVVDEVALEAALRENRIAGAALDVLKNEKDCASPLIDLPNVIVTPHMAFYSEGALVEMRQTAIKQVLQVLREGCLPDHLVNQDLLEGLDNCI